MAAYAAEPQLHVPLCGWRVPRAGVVRQPASRHHRARALRRGAPAALRRSLPHGLGRTRAAAREHAAAVPVASATTGDTTPQSSLGTAGRATSDGRSRPPEAIRQTLTRRCRPIAPGQPRAQVACPLGGGEPSPTQGEARTRCRLRRCPLWLCPHAGRTSYRRLRCQRRPPLHPARRAPVASRVHQRQSPPPRPAPPRRQSARSASSSAQLQAAEAGRPRAAADPATPPRLPSRAAGRAARQGMPGGVAQAAAPCSSPLEIEEAGRGRAKREATSGESETG
eukprot:scaffold286796_cov32-Tisochrysis_lutea.AAC.7